MKTSLKFPYYVKVSLLLIGMYVFISMLSIAQDIILPLIYVTIKLILDRIDSLKPWGFLLGDNTPPLVKLNLDFKDMSKKLPCIKSRLR